MQFKTQNKQKNLSKSYLQVVQALQALPEPLKINEALDSNVLIADLSKQLNLFKDAWPIIRALQQQGAHELIKILYEAEEASLVAFSKLTPGSDLTLLIDSFLIKNIKDLELVRRDRLTQFLLLPDLSNWLMRKCDNLVTQATHIMSYRFLLIAFAPCANELNKLAELKNCIASYVFPLQLETVWAICKLYQTELINDLSSPISNTFLLLFNDVLNTMDLTSQIEFIKGLQPEFLMLMVELCLQKSAQGEKISSQLLFLFCSELAIADTSYLDKLRTRLLQQDFYLFDNNSHLRELAQEIIQESPSAPKPNLNWIQQILTSARFVANSSSLILSRLTDRYGLYFLTLNPAEFKEFIASNQEHCAYMDSFHKHMKRIKMQLQRHPEEKNQSLIKYFNLLQFGRQRVVAALFFQLENLCHQQQTHEDLKTVEQALSTLYRHYCQIYPNVRSDILLQILNKAFDTVGADLCDRSEEIQDAELHTPGLLRDTGKDEIFPLLRFKEVNLYNSQGLCIGFILESNQALVFIDEEPVPLIQTHALEINDPVYTINGQILGYLTQSGHLRSALSPELELVAAVPEKQLERFPMGLNLLLHKALFENSLDTLYSYEQLKMGATKFLWLEKQFIKILQNTQDPFDPATLISLTKHLSEESLFQCLAKTKNSSNAFTLFHCILDNETTRDILMNGTYECDFQSFLKRHQVTLCLADYMSHYYDATWFEEGLERFVFFGKKHEIKQVFSETLSLLDKQHPTWDAIQKRLFGTEVCATILLKECLNDSTPTAVQQVQSPELNKLTQYVSQDSMTYAVQKLNKTPHWELSSLYKLMLHVFDKQYSLFSPSEPTQIKQASALPELIPFISRHLGKTRPLDKKHALGHRILGELIFSAAQPEHTRLFYSKGKFNKSLARLCFTKPFLERLLEKFFGTEDLIKEGSNWIIASKPKLEKNQVLEDWRLLIHQTWNENSTKKLPGLCAYLLNYTGETKPLLSLLRAYINAFQKQPEYLHALTGLLQLFPQRDFSAAIFDAMESLLIIKPSILDVTILQHMAQYYTKILANQDVKGSNAELNLLSYFGHNQYYALVQTGCEELSKSCLDAKLKKHLIQGATEAAVEDSLKDYKDHLFFGIIKAFKRLWHYGFNAYNSESKQEERLIAWCDDDSEKPSRKKSPQEIKLPSSTSPKEKTLLDFKEKREQFVNLLHTIKLTSKKLSIPLQPSCSTHTLFINNAENAVLNPKVEASSSLELSI